MNNVEISIDHYHLKIIIRALENGDLRQKIEKAHRASENVTWDKTKKQKFSFNQREICLIADSLGDLLLQAGIDDQGEINVIGRDIESIIDLLIKD